MSSTGKQLLVLVLLAACSSEGAKHKAAGNVLFKRGDFDGAAREYRAAIVTQPSDANAHTLLGNALFEKTDYSGARNEYQTALEKDPHARAALQGLVTLDLREQKLDDAQRRLEQMIAEEPRDAEAHAALGKLLLERGDLDGAERHLRDALVTAQNDRSAVYSLGLVLAKKHDQEQANAIFDRLERLTPGKAYAPYGRAVAAANAGRNDDALKWLGVAFARGIDDPAQVASDPSFAALRADPRFVELVTHARTRAPPEKGSPGP